MTTTSPSNPAAATEDEFETDLMLLLNEPDVNRNYKSRKRRRPDVFSVPAPLPSPRLNSLSEPITLHILSLLSAEDLMSIMGTCSHFNSLGRNDLLWHHLYKTRWQGEPPIEIGNDAASGRTSWLVTYKERDGLEVQSISSVEQPLQVIYRQRAYAKRSEPPPACTMHSVCSKNRTQVLVDSFRRARGLTINSYANNTGCVDTMCTFSHVTTNVWMCEACGRVHVCEDVCAEGGVDPMSHVLICPISGRCFVDRLVSEFEEDKAAADDGMTAAAEDWNAEEGMGGRLGRAFYAGYNADEGELLYKFGIRL